MSINRGVKVLIDEIKSTMEFKKLKEAKLNLNKYKDLKRELETLQRRQMELFKTRKEPQEIEKQANELNQEFQRLTKNPEVLRLVRAGEEFNRMMSRVYQSIGEMLDSELQ